MSRWLEKMPNGEIKISIESMKLCKWLINGVCCNDESDALGDYPYPHSICEDKYGCGCFEKEDEIIRKENKE